MLVTRLAAPDFVRVEGGIAWHHQVPRLLEAYEAAMKSDRGRVRQTCSHQVGRTAAHPGRTCWFLSPQLTSRTCMTRSIEAI
jgi:hypothetical protein